MGLALLLGAAGGLLAWRAYEAAKDEEAQRIATAAEASAGDIAQFVRGRIQILEALSSADVFVRADPAGIEDRLVRLDPSLLGIEGGVVWLDRANRVRARRGAAVAASAVAEGRLARAVERASSLGESQAGPTVTRSLFPEPVFVLIVPTRGADGRPNGALVGALPLDWLNGVASTRRQLRGGETLIVDRDGLLIVAPATSLPRDVSADPVLRRVRATGAVGPMPRGIALPDSRNPLGEGGRLMGAATDDGTTGWTVFVDRSSASAYADARRAFGIELVALILLAGLGAAAAAVLGRRLERGRRALEGAERRTRVLQGLTAALSAAATPSDVAEAVLRAGREATSADAGSIAVLTPDGSEFVTLGLVGYSEEVARSFGSYPADAPLPMPDCLRDGPLWLSDAGVVRRRYPHLKPFHAAMRHEAVAALPLRAGGRAIGGLALSFLDARRFDEEERTQLLAVADLCAQALDRARLYEEQRREAERERFLAEASTILATPLDPRETLAALARTAVPRLADWCSVSMERDGEVETVALAHVDPEKVALAERFTRRFPSSLSDPDGVGAVIRTGTSQLASVVTPELIEAAIPPGPRRDAVLELGLASVMTVPLRARGHTVGALVLASSNEGRRFGSDDLRFAEELGSRAGLAIENAALLDRSRRVSQMLQSSLLPARLPTVPGLDVAARYIAGGEGVDVGGDFYDLFAVPDEGTWIAVLGDVCGKGPEAAALTSLVRYTVRADAVDHPPGVVLERLNRAVLRQVGGNRFTTATCVRMSVGEEGVEATVVRGGHPPSVLVRADGRSELVQPGGPLIGVLETVSFESLRVRLAPGDALVLFSDGVTEARSPERDFFGIDRLVRAIRDASGGTADEIAGAIEGATDRFRRGAPRDDVAILVLRAGPAGGPGTDAAHGGR